MAGGKNRWTRLKLPDIKPGHWKGEILGITAVNFGQVVQPGPPRQAVEFTYMILPAGLRMAESHFEWPGVIMITAPTHMKTEFPDAGALFMADPLPSLSMSLEVTRAQFSDMLRMLEEKRVKEFHFTLEEKVGDLWPIHSWGMSARLS